MRDGRDATLRSTLVAFFGAAVLACQVIGARSELPDLRRHFELFRPGEKPAAYTITEINRVGNEWENSTHYLVRDAENNQFVISYVRSYIDQTGIYEIRDLNRKLSVRSTVTFPYKSKSRGETIVEGRKMERLDAPLPITVDAGGAYRTATTAEWKNSPNAYRWKAELRRSMDGAFLESIEEMRPLLATPEFLLFCGFIGEVILFDQSCARPNIFTERPAPPDCDFDRSFGMSCSDKQKDRVQRAKESGELLASY